MHAPRASRGGARHVEQPRRGRAARDAWTRVRADASARRTAVPVPRSATRVRACLRSARRPAWARADACPPRAQSTARYVRSVRAEPTDRPQAERPALQGYAVPNSATWLWPRVRHPHATAPARRYAHPRAHPRGHSRHHPHRDLTGTAPRAPARARSVERRRVHWRRRQQARSSRQDAPAPSRAPPCASVQRPRARAHHATRLPGATRHQSHAVCRTAARARARLSTPGPVGAARSAARTPPLWRRAARAAGESEGLLPHLRDESRLRCEPCPQRLQHGELGLQIRRLARMDSMCLNTPRCAQTTAPAAVVDKGRRRDSGRRLGPGGPTRRSLGEGGSQTWHAVLVLMGSAAVSDACTRARDTRASMSKPSSRHPSNRPAPSDTPPVGCNVIVSPAELREMGV